MNKLKREVIRMSVQLVIKSPMIFPEAFTKKIKKAWNANQLNNAIDEYEKHPLKIVKSDLPEGTQILELSCTSGFGEMVHPDVLFIPGGFGDGAWKYVMTLTPLPRGIEYFENPEFLVSHDGLLWKVPCGGKSPLIDAPSDWVGYNSDPSLYYENGTVYMIYRRTEYIKNGAIVRLLIIHTEDGVKWSAPRVILEEFHERKNLAVLMSPSVVKSNGEYFMWYVQGDDGNFSVIRARSGDLCQWSDFSAVTLKEMPGGTEPWHIDVIMKNEKELLMALCFQQTGNYRSDRGILFASSADDGLSWNVLDKCLKPRESAFCEKSLYKASAVFVDNGRLLLYYSGQDAADHWLTAVREIAL